MKPQLADAIREEARREGDRARHPEGFPILPGLPSERYWNEALFDLERECVFGKGWLFVAHESELAAAGDVLRFDGLTAPILLVRGTDGEIRAFFNACAHRGGPLSLEATCNVGTRLVCRYHGWAFDLEGKLRSIPDRRDYAHVDLATHALRPVRCARWGNLVFINLDDDGPGLREALAPIIGEVDDEIGDAVGGGDVSLLERREFELACNWKLPTEANIESYHVNIVHRETGALILHPQATGMWLLPEGHSRMFVSNRAGVEHAAVTLPSLPHVDALGGEGIFSYLGFPNLILSLSPSLVFAITIWPLAPDRCRYAVHTMGVARTAETSDAWDAMIGFLWQVLEEDLAILEMLQRNLRSSPQRDLIHGYQERRIYYLHEEIDRRIGSGRLPAGCRVEPVLGDWVEK